MTTYVFLIDPTGEEVRAEGETEALAYEAAWAALSIEQRSCWTGFECTGVVADDTTTNT
ncbi:MAG: hypothetical protein JWL63_2710 [Rhodocyclales bacterium]|nr:hypothetical protein [Rhodocyclales bacterium]